MHSHESHRQAKRMIWVAAPSTFGLSTIAGYFVDRAFSIEEWYGTFGGIFLGIIGAIIISIYIYEHR